MSLKVLVADDTALFRRVITEALRGVPDVEVVGTANNGKMVLSRIAALQPDLVTLDIEMPEMNGIEVLEAMRPGSATPVVVVVSSLTSRGGHLTVRALELGAFDFITKPERGTPEQNIELVRNGLIPIIRALQRGREIRSILGRSGGKPAPVATPRPAAPPPPRVAADEPAPRAPRRSGPPIVLIGVSTGGPAALARLLPSLPSNLGAPVFIVQHMPALFTGPLADSLRKKCTFPVTEAIDGETAVAGHAYLAPGGRHMKILPGANGEIVLRITDDPPEHNCRPAVDYLFRSAALHFPGRSIAAILTGMGNDGTEGLRLLKRSGCVSIAQDEASCVVFGMPKEAIAAGVVDTVAPLDAIGGVITRSLREGRA